MIRSPQKAAGQPAGLPPGCEALVTEDDPLLRRRLAAHLSAAGAHVSEAGSLTEARNLLASIRFDLAVLDLHLPDGEALELLRDGTIPETTVIVVMTAFGGFKPAVEAMQLGAADYLAKPFEPDEIVLAFLRAHRVRTAARREQHRTMPPDRADSGLIFGEGLAGVRRQLDAILATEHKLGRNLPPILIEGETGTGKTALARWLHARGPRASLPFIHVNCGALPDALAETELFGHERGAFTDAKTARIGLFEAADGGTLFLDEITSLSSAVQAKVLLAVDGGRIRRMGGSRELTVDVRLMAASNQPVAEAVRGGHFREDLFHRLNLLNIRIPPLRERGADIVMLARALLEQITARHNRRQIRLTPAAEARLAAGRWPGNVRELAHELERAVIFAEDDHLDLAHLAPSISVDPSAAAPTGPSWKNPAWALPETGFSLEWVTDAFVSEALRATGGNVSAAARRLGVTRDFIRYHLEQHRPGSGQG